MIEEWKEDSCGERGAAKVVEANGVRFCSLPHQPYVSLLGRYSARVSRGFRRGPKESLEHVWYAGVYQTQSNGCSHLVDRRQIVVDQEERDEECKREAFEWAADLIKSVQ